MTSEAFAGIRPSLPNNPGIYRYYDKGGKLLYVGKAKNIKKRVSSYFTKKKNMGAKLTLLVRQINKIEYSVVNNERDALLLENTLIKKHQPKYNVMLKDDKTYPYIVIKKEPFPRIFFTRKFIRDGSEYFGPYTSLHRSRAILNFIKDLYPLRTCNLNLSPEKVEAGKYKVCLEYHIKNCLGPCVGGHPKRNYDKNVGRIREILRGDLGGVVRDLKESMKVHAANLDFEKAQEDKDRLAYIDTFKLKSTVVNPRLKNLDVMGIASAGNQAFVNYLKVSNGSIIQIKSLEIKQNLDESTSDLLQIAYLELESQGIDFGKELLAGEMFETVSEITKVIVPKIGDKKKLLDLSTHNAMVKLKEKERAKLNLARRFRVNPVLQKLQEDLRMKELPVHIECFDNSNFQGDSPVASVVCFKNGKPFKSEYRHFNIKTVSGPNDFASMEEVVFRRYRRLLEEDSDLPQLIIIDGGKGQLSSAVKSLKLLGISDKLTVIGIAKKLEEIYFPGDSLPLYIDKRSPSLKLIQQARNEAHRFAIEFHRKKRDKKTLKTELTDIKGIGPKTAEKLLSHFKSVTKIKSASKAELKAVAGNSKANIIFKKLSKVSTP